MEDVSRKLEELSKKIDDAKSEKIRLEEHKKQILKEKADIIKKLEEMGINAEKADTIISGIENELKKRLIKLEKEISNIDSENSVGSDLDEINKILS